MSTTAAPPTGSLDIQEALASKPSVFDEDGNVKIHIMRPCKGLGKGRHTYTPEMLEANAGVFEGWKMYVDHESPQAKKARGHLPPPIQRIGGRILESYWDGDVPPEGRYGQGAVVGKVKPVGQARKLLEEDPEILEASVRAKATDVTPDPEDSSYWVVEGIRDQPPGSVDWVSEGGAGGRVADILESMVQEIDEEDQEDTPAEGGDEVSELLEALKDPQSDAAKAVLELVESRADERVREVTEKHETELEEAREASEDKIAEAREEGRTEARRLTGNLEKATELIEESKLPEPLKAKLRSRYAIDEAGEPSEALDVDSAAVIEETVKSEIEEGMALAREINPAAVKGQGASKESTETQTGTLGSRPQASNRSQGFHREWLEEAGMDADEAWFGDIEIREDKSGDDKEDE